jgi:hypothetical protein
MIFDEISRIYSIEEILNAYKIFGRKTSGKENTYVCSYKDKIDRIKKDE